MVVSLFEGRHELPTNEGAICSDFDFNTFKAVRTELWKKCIEHLYRGDVKLIVTGLTPALCEFLAEAVEANMTRINKHFNGDLEHEPVGYLFLLHYDNVKKEYREQKIF